MKSPRNPFSASEPNEVSPAIKAIKMTRMLGKTLRLLDITYLTDAQKEHIRMYLRYNNHAGAEVEKYRTYDFGLKECKEYVERLYINGILK
jgi:hypothetical protein